MHTTSSPLLPLAAFVMAFLAVARLFDTDGDLAVPGVGMVDQASYDRAAGAALAALEATGDRDAMTAAMARELYANYGTSDYQALLRAEASMLLAFVENHA